MASDGSDLVANSTAVAATSTSIPRPKSPPLAFEPTPNDSLAPRISSSQSPSFLAANTSTSTDLSSPSAMGRLPSPTAESLDLQVVVDQQASALNLLHDAFAAERQSWTLERERLYARIASLERLLKTGDHYSPAKSPVLSPSSTNAYTSPHARASLSNHHLPSIAEDVRLEPLSRRREGAPRSISIPPIREEEEGRRNSVVGFAEDASHAVQVQTIPVSPRNSRTLSPPPLSFRREAGHTPPLHAKRPPTPPPKNSLSMDGIEDTPTRNNTHINTYLTRSDDEEDDKALEGPLHLPELPRQPNETNFTLEMLSRKLEMIEKHPEEITSRPMVFAQPSPGLASPVDEEDDVISPKTQTKSEEAPIAPISTRNAEPSTAHSAHSSNLSPSAISPNGAPLSQHESRERQVHQQFEQGGIKLKKKPSSNFGAPFGQLGGFGNVRKLS